MTNAGTTQASEKVKIKIKIKNIRNESKNILNESKNIRNESKNIRNESKNILNESKNPEKQTDSNFGSERYSTIVPSISQLSSQQLDEVTKTYPHLFQSKTIEILEEKPKLKLKIKPHLLLQAQQPVQIQILKSGCQEQGCSVRFPSFNYIGQTKGLYCSRHQLPNMEDVKHPKCKFAGCKTRPSFNYEGQKSGLYCYDHQLDGMSSVDNRHCLENGCKTRPCFNYDGEAHGLYCYKHKLDGMDDVVHVKCIADGCQTRPNFNYITETFGLYCYDHQLDGMENVTSDRCIFKGCKKFPSFNFEGETKRLYCFDHKLDGMEDVAHEKCIFEGCKTQPSYNYEGEKQLYCYNHKLDGMVDVISRRCNENGCNIRPSFNYDGQTTGLYCYDHQLDNMVNVVDERCQTPLCPTRANKKYEGYCFYCYVHVFPDREISRNYKTKERAVVDFVVSKYSQFKWTPDKTISGGCSLRRPDLLLDLGYQVLIIEIDENQHQSYDCSCENKRIMELSQDVEHRPIVFIRFNPDDYIDQQHKNVTSCWGLNGNGFCTVKKTKKDEWAQRLNILSEHIDYWINESNVTDKTVEIIQLFYDINI